MEFDTKLMNNTFRNIIIIIRNKNIRNNNRAEFPINNTV